MCSGQCSFLVTVNYLWNCGLNQYRRVKLSILQHSSTSYSYLAKHSHKQEIKQYKNNNKAIMTVKNPYLHIKNIISVFLFFRHFLVPPNITSPAVGFTYTVNSSDPVTFQCTASGIPPPLIIFYDSYGPLSSDVDPRVIISDPITGSVTIGQQSVFTTSRNLTINSTRDGDSGNYTCEASNQGVATLYSNLTFQLVVQCKQ